MLYGVRYYGIVRMWRVLRVVRIYTDRSRGENFDVELALVVTSP